MLFFVANGNRDSCYSQAYIRMSLSKRRLK